MASFYEIMNEDDEDIAHDNRMFMDQLKKVEPKKYDETRKETQRTLRPL